MCEGILREGMKEETSANLNIWNSIWSCKIFNFFFSSVSILNSGTRDIVKFPSSEIFKSCLDRVSATWRGLNQITSGDPFQLQPHSFLWKEALCYELFNGLTASFRFIPGIHTKFCCCVTHFLCWITHSQNVGWSNFEKESVQLSSHSPTNVN